MARPKNPKRDEAFLLWKESGGERKLKDIADELGTSASTIRKWKSEDGWENESNRSAPIEKERYGTLRANQNAAGNSGGGAPSGNKNAVSHGLFADWLPDDTRDLIDAIGEASPADIVWQNIIIQYAAIIRSQKLMYVTNHDDMSKEISSSGDMVTTYDVQYAWDKQATFLAAQSRAMGTLANLIKQFEAMTDDHDERRLKLEGMKATVDKTKAEAVIAEVRAKEATDDGEGYEDKLADVLDKISDKAKEEVTDDGA
ncbi:phage terminase small subunit [Lacticaseibacillus saniviri]